MSESVLDEAIAFFVQEACKAGGGPMYQIRFVDLLQVLLQVFTVI